MATTSQNIHARQESLMVDATYCPNGTESSPFPYFALSLKFKDHTTTIYLNERQGTLYGDLILEALAKAKENGRDIQVLEFREGDDK